MGHPSNHPARRTGSHPAELSGPGTLAPSARHWFGASWLALGIALLGLVVLGSSGCSGCQPETPQQRAARLDREAKEEERRLQERQKKEEQQARFLAKPPTALLSDPSTKELAVKPGHWSSVVQTIEANRDDFVGQSTLAQLAPDRSQIAVPRTRFSLLSSRDVALPKKQPKRIETVLLPHQSLAQTQLTARLLEPGGGMAYQSPRLPVGVLLPHQYHLLVLAAEPQRYGFLKSLYSVNAPGPGEPPSDPPPGGAPFNLQYIVSAQALGQQAPAPEATFCWTSIAVVVWDEVDPDLLTSAQQASLIDWLHWGGQLAISGPDSLELLRGSFLAPYLPAETKGAAEITSAKLAPLNDRWSAAVSRAAPLRPAKPWSGITLDPLPGAAPVEGCGGLVVERPVGRGRVLVTAFQLAERDLLSWQAGVDNFFNAVVLRRPARRFTPRQVFFGDDDNRVVVEWANSPQRTSAADNTALRYFVRDTYNDGDAAVTYSAPQPSVNEYEDIPQGPTPPVVVGGYGAWSDFSVVANVARDTLRKAAGVQIPSRWTILACLGVYLVLLAPVNWLFFHTLGRVELAWIVAPVIAAAATVIVVRQAQLDIGFVRAQTEVALLETQPGYARGCLTRFTAMYTSLATTYELEFEDGSAVAAPFAVQPDFELLPGEQLTPIEFARQQRVRLRNLFIGSSSTTMTHSEQMLTLPGPIALGVSAAGLPQITNRSGLKLTSLAVVERPAAAPNTLRGCWIGELAAGATSPVSFATLGPVGADPLFQPEREKENARGGNRLDLEPMFAVSLRGDLMEPGEARAVARHDAALPGMTVTPRASQSQGATLVVAHLRPRVPPAPQGDLNAPIDVPTKPQSPTP